MKAISVTPDRTLEIRTVPMPEHPPAGHILVDIAACAINHGDKTFLRSRGAASLTLAGSLHDIWGVSGAGRVVAVGEGVPQEVLGRQVGIYRSLSRSNAVVGLWCERAQVPFSSAVLLPEAASAVDYSGSLVNAFTAFAFLEEIVAAGHRSVVVTAGTSATGKAFASLAKARGIEVIAITRKVPGDGELAEPGAAHLLAQTDPDFTAKFERLAGTLNATAVFDGVGGELVGRIAPLLPVNATIYVYGVLAGIAPMALSTAVILGRNLVLRRFSNFESATARDPVLLASAMTRLADVIADPVFRTPVGKRFRLEEIAAAMEYETTPGMKAVLIP
jgi:NADPH:quinone reductase